MDVLPARTYSADPQERRRMAPFGLRHPAKLSLPLCIDLMHRYTRPGQTWLDPFYGVGTTGLLVLHGRSVIGIELEAHHAEDARKNAAHLAQWARGGATATVIQGDSRRLRELLAEARASGTMTSPPFGEMNAAHAGGAVKLRPAKDGGFEGDRSDFVYSEDTPGQIGNMPMGTLSSPPYGAQDVPLNQSHSGGYGRNHRRSGVVTPNIVGYGAPAGTLCSPPYGDVASRNRSQEPYASKDAARAKEYGQDDCARNVDGYGKDGAQIGNLPMGTLTSPPYADAQLNHHNAERPDATTLGIGRQRQHRTGSLAYDRPEHPDNLGSQDKEDYLHAVRDVYAAVYDVTPSGGVLVLVTGNYIRSGAIVDLAAHTIAVCEAVGWTPVERWEAKKQNVSFWRRLHDQRERRQAALEGRPPRNLLIDGEDVLCFVKGDKPGWAFADLPPQKTATHEQASLVLEDAAG